MNVRPFPLIVMVGAALTLGACGSGDAGVSAPASKLLNVQVDAIRASAVREDRTAAMQQLVALRNTVDKLQSDGELSGSAAARIRRSADGVQSALGLLPAPTTTTTTTTTTPSTGRSDGHKDNGQSGGKTRHGGSDEG